MTSLAGVYRAEPIDFSKGTYFSFYKQVECRWKGEDFRGLFAMENIKAGEVIWVNRTDDHPTLKEVITDSATIESWPEEKQEYYLRHVWQLGDDLFASAPSADAVNGDSHNFWNHSCDPNVWICGDDIICARRDIAKGEEMCFDYSSTDCRYMGFEKCFCGSPKCRGYISKDDWMMQDLQVRYGNHFMTYMLRKIERLNVEREEAEVSQRKNRSASDEKLAGSISSASELSETSGRTSDDDDDEAQKQLSTTDPLNIEFSDPKNPVNNRSRFGVGALYCFIKGVELRETVECGQGVFARDRIPAGTLVWHFHDHMESLISSEQIGRLSKEGQAIFRKFSFQVDDDLFMGATMEKEVTRDARLHLNHSCDPNLWLTDDRRMVARRDIMPNEELTVDYATSETSIERVSACKCGSPNCRGRIRGTDWRIPELRRRYAGHFVSYIQRRIDVL